MDELGRFFERFPEIETIDALMVDLCGMPRGKRLGRADAAKLYKSGAYIPGSMYLLDAQGATLPAGPGNEDGDPDCICRPVPGSLVPVPWVDRPRGQVLVTMFEPDGRPYALDPRQILAGVLARFAARGQVPVVAFELEFFLLEPESGDQAGVPCPARSPADGRRLTRTDVLSVTELDDFADLLDEIGRCAAAQGLQLGAFTSEHAPGQFEINLHHIPDALRAADLCVMFQRLVRGVARRHGKRATFMAKPYAETSGSGMHLHVSLIDGQGRNLFDDGGDGGSAALRHALGGLADCAAESMLLCAPNLNSFRRYGPGLFVPRQTDWGYNRRDVAFRIPLGAPADRRIEHRVAGADANPYLVAAGLLAGIDHGLASRADPGPPREGTDPARGRPLPVRFTDAVHALEAARILPGYLGPDYCRLYAQTKVMEADMVARPVNPVEYQWYLLSE